MCCAVLWRQLTQSLLGQVWLYWKNYDDTRNKVAQQKFENELKGLFVDFHYNIYT